MTILATVFLLVGAAFCLLAAIGILRLPDLYCRMHAATKAGAFGAACMLVAAAICFQTPKAIVAAILMIFFFYVTAPVAAHIFGRAAYGIRVPLWKGTRKNEWDQDLPQDKHGKT